MAYFPMFVELNNRPCLIVGGGKVAFRKVCVLKDFGAQITVIAEMICEEIKQIENVTCIEKKYEPTDLDGMELVVAATDDKDLNHFIGEECKNRKIAINAVDQVEDCSFIFPSYIKELDLVAAFSSGGKSPVMTQYLKSHMQAVLTEELGALTECLGSIRPEVKQKVDTEAKRKKVYQEVLEIGLNEGKIPTKEAIETVIRKYAVNDRSE